MDFTTFVNSHLTAIISGLLAINLLLLIWLIKVQLKLNHIAKNRKILYKNIDFNNIEEIVNNCLAEVHQAQDERKKVNRFLKSLAQKTDIAIKEPVLMRYSSMENVGSNQSFSVALLNRLNNGVILTSLHTREANHLYLKQIVNGEPQHFLTDEEKEVLQKSLEI